MHKARKQSPERRAFGMLWKWGKGYFIIGILKVLFDKFVPFFNIWISAEIITALYEGIGTSAVKILVIAALIGNLAVRVISAFFGHLIVKQEKILVNNEKAAFNEKVVSMDYCKLEDTKYRDIRRKIVTNSWINNYGTAFLRRQPRDIFGCIIGIAYSLVLFTEMIVSILTAGFNVKGMIFFIGLLLTIIVNVVWVVCTRKKESGYWKKYGNLLLDDNRFSDGIPEGDKDIRIYNMAPVIRKYWNKMTENHKKVSTETNMKVFFLRIPAEIFETAIKVLSYLIVSLYCALGIFPIGSVIKYVGYLSRFVSEIEHLFAEIGRIRENRPYLEDYLKFWDIPNEMYQGSLTVEKRSDRNYEVEFRNVSFKYPGSENYALKNVNMKFRIGERLAVVGMNGSGKTTFIKLLCRLYDPTEGEILLNGINIRKYDYRQYLDVFSVVFQDYNIFSFPLGNNISADGTYDSEKAEKCIEDVGFGERYRELPKKLETPIYKQFDNSGVNISGGEAQKIALARALYKNAPFIILDEPTAALDPIAEAEIYSNFNNIVGDKTAIYISHRLSSCRFCDEIAVFDQGLVVQKGTHDALVADEGGKYHELWYAQAQYYTEKA